MLFMQQAIKVRQTAAFLVPLLLSRLEVNTDFFFLRHAISDGVLFLSFGCPMNFVVNTNCPFKLCSTIVKLNK